MPTPPDFTSGTALAAATLNKVGFWLIDTQTVTAGTSLAFTSKLTTDFDNYRIVFAMTGNQPAGQNQVNLRVRNGTTDLNSGTVYKWVRNFFAPGPTTGVSGSNGANEINLSDVNAGIVSFVVDLIAPRLAQPTMLSAQTTVRQPIGNTIFGIVTNGIVDNSTTYDGINLYSNATFTATARLYGYRN